MLQNLKHGVVLGGYGSPKVIGNVTIRQSVYDFLLVFNKYRTISRYGKLFVEIRRLYLPHLHLAPPLGVTRLNFKKIFASEN